jgi:hypothetical protein
MWKALQLRRSSLDLPRDAAAAAASPDKQRDAAEAAASPAKQRDAAATAASPNLAPGGQ